MASPTLMTAFAIALGVAFVLTPIVIAAARQTRLIDVPGHRSSHATPVPRGGGVAVAVASIVAVAFVADWSRSTTAVVSLAAGLGLVGLADDRLGLPALPRLVAQFAGPLGLAVWLLEDHPIARLALAIAAAVWVAGFVNAFNFMDGINAISSLQAAVCGGVLAVIADRVNAGSLQPLGLAVAGSALGFLPFNAPRARIFLGDVGSYFIGSWLAGLALVLVDTGASALVVAAPFMLYCADTGAVLVRRARRGAPLMEPHREHAYQRLVQAGHSHVAVATVYALVPAACGLAMVATIDAGLAVRLVVLAVCAAIVALVVAAPDLLYRSEGAG